MIGDHQAGVQHSLERPPGTLHGVNRRHQHLLLDAVQHLLVHQRSRAVGPHAAGVGTGVVVVSPLVVLGRRQRDNRAAVGNGQHAHFLAVEPFLDDNLIAGIAKFAIPADPFDRFDRFGPRRANKNSFAGRQSIGLDHHRHILAVLQKPRGVVGIAKHLVVGSGDVGVPQQRLAKDLAPFELGRPLAGTKHAQLGLAKRVDHAQHQRRFRSRRPSNELCSAGQT